MVVNIKPNIDKEYYRILRSIIHNCRAKGPASQFEGNLQKSRNSLLGKINHVKRLSLNKGKKLMDEFHLIKWTWGFKASKCSPVSNWYWCPQKKTGGGGLNPPLLTSYYRGLAITPFPFSGLGVKMGSWFCEGYWGKLVFGLLTGNFSLNFPLLYLK